MARRIAWLGLYVAATAAPPVLIFASSPFARGTPSYGIAFSIGAWTFTWLCAQMVMAARLHGIDRAFGLDRVYRFHGFAALAIVALAFTHATVMDALGVSESLMAALGSAGLWSVTVLVAVALLLMASATTARLALVRRLRAWCERRLGLNFRRVVWLHNLLPLAGAVLLAHIWLLQLDEFLPLKLLLSAYYAVGLAAYLHHKIGRPLRARRRPWTVAAVERENPEVTTLTLRPAYGKVFAFAPGQFLFLRLHSEAVSTEEHPFTISSSPRTRDTLTVTVKASGDYTATLPDVAVGDRADVVAPFGRFTYRHLPADRPLCLLAGGIGITPFLSMLRTLVAESPNRNITLLWGARTSVDLMGADELLAWERDLPHFRFIPVLSREANGEGLHGHLDAERIRALVGKRDDPAIPAAVPEQTEFFVCGPPAMIRDVVRHLRTAGVPKSRIHYERFAL